MPSGIVMQSGSTRGTATDEERQQAIEKVLIDNDFEVEKPAAAAPVEPVEPKRDDFQTDEEFEAAQADFEAKQEEAEAAKQAEEDKKEEERQRKHPSRRQRAIDRATKQLHDDLRKANERIAALEGGKGGKKSEEVKAPEAPKREQFKSDDEFEEAKFQYRYKMQRAKEQAEEAQKSVETRLKENFADYQAAAADFKEEHDDWDEVVNEKVRITDAVYYAIVELAGDGPAVSYYLGKNPKEADRLAELTPYRAAIEVGRLADKLKAGGKSAAAAAAGAEKKTQPRSRVPEPVVPVRTAATASTLTSREAAQRRDYKAFKRAQAQGA